jgi:glycogen debranching enzyme
MCEVQGYVYAARQRAAALARALGMVHRADQLDCQANQLRDKFETAFWCDELDTYAIALDVDKQPCKIRTSNAGQCLFSGIVAVDRARRVASGLLSPNLFTGWGIRTLAATDVHYNPMSYHNGTVWPHDNSLIAYGCSKYDLQNVSSTIMDGLFDAANYFDLNRMPELFCGFERVAGEGPVLYPVACSPQSWAAGSAFLLLQACLGLEISAVDRQVRFNRPQLPSSLPGLRVSNLVVADATIDLTLVRHGSDVSVNVLNRKGNVSVTTTS